jgi:hypothetical protein
LLPVIAADVVREEVLTNEAGRKRTSAVPALKSTAGERSDRWFRMYVFAVLLRIWGRRDGFDKMQEL